jgi:putative nucleotidyltransferase with HDIG domain
MNENFDAFDKYVMNYDMNERMIEYKYNHSYRVVHQSEEICRSLDLDNVERDLASLIALLHDIARFRQWTDYKTFRDKDSFDHGDEGEKILFEEGEIKNYICDKEDYDIIRKAVRNHNKYIIEDGLSERELLHSKIVRDADKIDILYAFSTNRLLEIDNDDSPINEEVRKQFYKHESIDRKIVKSVNDRAVAKFSLIFDLYYDYSLKRVYSEKYIDKIYEGMKNKELFKEFYEETIRFLKKRCNDDRK